MPGCLGASVFCEEGLEWSGTFICKEFPDGSGEKHHSSLAGMCLDFTVLAKCAHPWLSYALGSGRKGFP